VFALSITLAKYHVARRTWGRVGALVCERGPRLASRYDTLCSEDVDGREELVARGVGSFFMGQVWRAQRDAARVRLHTHGGQPASNSEAVFAAPSRREELTACHDARREVLDVLGCPLPDCPGERSLYYLVVGSTVWSLELGFQLWVPLCQPDRGVAFLSSEHEDGGG
jgi:hypothetical protein